MSDFYLKIGNLQIESSNIQIKAIDEKLTKFNIEFPSGITVFQGSISMIDKLYDQLGELLVQGISGVLNFYKDIMLNLQSINGTVSDYVSFTVQDSIDISTIEGPITFSAADEIWIGSPNGIILYQGPVFISVHKTGSTQLDSGAAQNEIWVTNGHATLPNGVMMIGL